MTAQRPLVNACIGTAVLGLLVGGALVRQGVSDSDANKGPSPLGVSDAATTAVGAYVGYGPTGVRRLVGLSRWLGGREVRVGHSYLPGDLWVNIEGSPGFLRAWADWRRAADDRMFVLNTPMLERNEAGVPDAEVRRLLRAADRGLVVMTDEPTALGKILDAKGNPIRNAVVAKIITLSPQA